MKERKHPDEMGHTDRRLREVTLAESVLAQCIKDLEEYERRKKIKSVSKPQKEKDRIARHIAGEAKVFLLAKSAKVERTFWEEQLGLPYGHIRFMAKKRLFDKDDNYIYQNIDLTGKLNLTNQEENV